MCGHGTIGLVDHARASRPASGRGEHRIETPVGIVTATLHETARVTVDQRAELSPAQGRERRGAGPWARSPATSRGAATGSSSSSSTAQELALEQRRARSPTFAWRIRQALKRRHHGAMARRSTTSSCSAPPREPARDSRNFVLCPGQGLRPLAVRHRHQRQARVPRRRRQARRARAGARRASSAAVFERLVLAGSTARRARSRRRSPAPPTSPPRAR